MARAQLPRSVWLAILQALGYRELKVTQLVCRLFRDLYADCSLDEATYRKGPAAVETQPSRRAANDAEDGYDSDDDDENYVALHTLLDADDAAHGFPHAQWYGSTSFDEIAIAGPRKVRTLLCQNPAKDEMATVPALRRLVVAQNWDGIEPEPTELVNPHGVTVGQVVRAWCDLMEQALEIDEDDTVANAPSRLEMGIYAMPWAAASLGSGTRGASRMFDSDDDEDDRFGGGDDQRVFFPTGWAAAMPRIQAENSRSDSFPGGM